MPAPGSLYGEGAGLLEAAGGQASNIASDKLKQEQITTQAGESAGAELGAQRQQMSGQQAAMALEKMKASDKMQGKVVTLTPQMALGLSKNTGDPAWMQAVGQEIRADVLMGLYTHGMSLAYAKKAPKITDVMQGGKLHKAIIYTDESGTPVQHMLADEGETPDQRHPRGGAGGKGAGDMDFKKKKEFLAQYTKRKAEYSDPIKASEVQKLSPDKYSEDIQWLKDNQDTYDSITKEMAKGTGGGAKPGVAPVGGDSGAPFDPDAFIQEALGG